MTEESREFSERSSGGTSSAKGSVGKAERIFYDV